MLRAGSMEKKRQGMRRRPEKKTLLARLPSTHDSGGNKTWVQGGTLVSASSGELNAGRLTHTNYFNMRRVLAAFVLFVAAASASGKYLLL